MTKTIIRMLLGLVLLLAGHGVVAAQSRTAAAGEAKDMYPNEVLAELRLTRQLIQQLKKELVELQVAAIQIRIQQDAVAAMEVRLDSIRSESRLTEEALTQLRDRISKLESLDPAQPEEDEQQRTRAELQDARKEAEHQQQKLDVLRAQDLQLVAQLQIERARLSELLSRLDSLSPNTGAATSNAQSQTSGPAGSPNN